MFVKNQSIKTCALLLVLCMLFPAFNASAESDEELAKKTLNPVASLISLPLQLNQDYNIGAEDASRTTLNIQPVIPVSVNQDMNVIIRTIVPFIWAESPVDGGENVSGMGDTVQSFFLSPKDPWNGWIIGFGPVFLYPTAAEDSLGSQRWGAGPTGVMLRQDSGFTYGLLFNHIWSFSGNDDRAKVSATFLQPFFGYSTKTFTTLMVNTESTYDTKTNEWTVPINVTLSQMLKIAGQPLTLQVGYRNYTDVPEGGPNWGLRFAITFLFPKG